MIIQTDRYTKDDVFVLEHPCIFRAGQVVGHAENRMGKHYGSTWGVPLQHRLDQFTLPPGTVFTGFSDTKATRETISLRFVECPDSDLDFLFKTKSGANGVVVIRFDLKQPIEIVARKEKRQ